MQADAKARRGSRIEPEAREERGAQFFARIEAEPLAVRMLLYALLSRFSRLLGREDAGTVELVLAEVMNNITEHAYADTQGGAIEVTARLERGRLCCEVGDWGIEIPAAVLTLPSTPQADSDLTDLPEGGWGWSLIFGLTEALRYRREGGRNDLSFEIPLKFN
jgi:serine/threonine-protein kinase RsbW